MFNIVPWYVRLIALAALVIGLLSFGFLQGVKWEEGRVAIANQKAEQKQQQITHELVKRYSTIQKVYVERAQKREETREKVNADTSAHAALPDSRQCWLDDDRVRSINDAWLDDADSGGVPSGLREDAPAEERQPSGGGAVGQGQGLRLPRVFGPAPRAVGDGSSQAEGGR